MNKNKYFRNKKRNSMLEAFRKYLLSNDIEVQNEKDGTAIYFERNTLQYIFNCEKSDPYYFRIILPNILKVTSDNKQEILQLVNSVNLKFKVAKSVIVEDENVWVSVELFAYSMNNIDELFNRAFILHETVLNEYKEYLKKC